MRIAPVLAGALLAAPALVGASSANAEDEVAAACVQGSGQLINTPSRPLARLGAQNLALRAAGSGITVAVVDSGVDAKNPHQLGRVLPGRSFVEGVPNARGDQYGHGTAVAGIIAAQPVPRSMLVGLAPRVKILPVRVFVDVDENTPAARRPRVEAIAAGIRWAGTRADVINVSLSTKDDDPALRAAVEFAVGEGAVVVASAGNRSNQGTQLDTASEPRPDGVRYPAGYDGVLGVTAVDYGDEGATYDSVGGPHVDVAAPGVDVLTAFFGG
ncbi:MAG: S8 family serine peptidase, partial [Sporichthyaceae bacterium]